SILTTILGVDDLFMLHDGVLWIIFRFGESKLMPIWIALAVIWGLLFLPELLGNPDMLIFAGAVIFFAFGMFGDMAPDSIFGLGHEEAAKLAGIMLWALWALWTAQREVVKEFADPRLQVAATP